MFPDLSPRAAAGGVQQSQWDSVFGRRGISVQSFKPVHPLVSVWTDNLVPGCCPKIWIINIEGIVFKISKTVLTGSLVSLYSLRRGCHQDVMSAGNISSKLTNVLCWHLFHITLTLYPLLATFHIQRLDDNWGHFQPFLPSGEVGFVRKPNQSTGGKHSTYTKIKLQHEEVFSFNFAESH